MNLAAVLKALRPRFGLGRRSSWGAATLGSWRASEVRTRTWATGTDSYDTAYVEPAANAIIQATVLWLARAFPEAPLRVQRRTRDGGLEPIPNHPLTALVANPTPFYAGPLLWHATIADWVLTGNAFWLKVRNGAGRPNELWWLPAQTVRVQPDETGDRFVSYYEYTPSGGREVVRYAPADVVHFRYGMDPSNPTCGLSPLGALLREVLTDDEASRFSASLLRNMAVPGVILSPAEPVSQTDAEAVKSKFRHTFGGSRRGDVLVMRAPSTVSVLSFSPQQMDLKALRRLPEERVSAVLGIPAVVVGLGAGLDRSTFCLPADARVWTPTGPVRIADVTVNRIVWSFVDGRLEPRRVVRAGRTGHKALYEVRTKNRKLRATGNHPVLVRVPGRLGGGGNATRQPAYAWRRVEELRCGDHIVQPRRLPDQGETVLPDGTPATADFLRFCGAIVGDGTVRPGVGVRIAMPPTDRCAADYRALAVGLFTRQVGSGGKIPSALLEERLPRAPVTLQERERDFGFSSAAASRRLGELGFGGRAATKRVPSWVWGLSSELRLAFLAGLVDTDGSVDKRGALTFGFCNQALAHDVRDLLVSVGIQACNVRHTTVPGANLPQPGRRDSYDAWFFTASSAIQVARIPFGDPVYRERVHANPDRVKTDGFDAHKTRLSSDLGFYAVKAIRTLEPEDVYDLEVEGGHSFVADGVVVHNSNFEEARQAAYESNVVPSQRLFAAELQTQLLPDFDTSGTQQVDFDLGQVRVLQPDLDKLWTRLDVGVQGGWVLLNEARAQVGLPALPDGDVLYVGVAKTPTDPADLLAAPEPLPAPTPLRALPPGEDQQAAQPKALTPAGTKAAGSRYPAGLERIRARTAPPLERAVAKELERQRAAAVAAVHGGEKALNPDDFIASIQAAAGLLRAVQRAYRAVLAQVVPLAEGTLGVPAQPDALSIADYLAEAATRVAGITETTRLQLVDALRESVALGESTQQTAKRVEDLTAFSRSRATTISRTEVAHASQQASLSSFRASGLVVGVLVLDGDDCGLHTHDGLPKANGLRFPLEAMGDIPTLAHPRCVRAFSPLVSADELVAVA